MSLENATTPEDRAVMERLGFKLDTAYMEVPACCRCQFWAPLRTADSPANAIGLCSSLSHPERVTSTPRNFGCNNYRQRTAQVDEETVTP